MSTAPSRPAISLTTANLLCMGSMLIWASGLPAADLLIPLMAYEQLNALRMGLSALFLLGLWAALEGPAPLLRFPWLRGILVGSLLGFGAWLLILGQARGGAVTAAVISAMLPVVGIALEVALDGRKLTAALVLGLIMSLVGGVIALDLAGGGLTLGLGALLCFFSVLSFAVGSRLTVTAFPDHSSIGRTAITLTGAALATLISALVTAAFGTPAPSFAAWGLKELGAILLFSVGALGIAQYMFIIAVDRIGIGMSSIHINAAPFYVMLILFALGGAWNWTQAGGAAIVGLGVLVAQGLIPLPFGRRP